MSRIDYDKDRTDNIELLFKAIYYAELVENTTTQTNALRKKLMTEFKQFPVVFDKQMRASRYAHPFRYSENGVVSISTTENNHFILLDQWEPKNRPVPVEKKKRKVQPNYNALLNVNPIWFLQVMLHKGRKTVLHRNYPTATITTEYRNKYKENQILRTLPAEEAQHMLTTHRDEEMSYQLGAALSNFRLELYPLRNLGEIRHSIEFFFLNENETELLSDAMERDNVKNSFEWYSNNPNTDRALNQIIMNPPGNRETVKAFYRKQPTRRIKSASQYGGTIEIIDHEPIWERLHHQYARLSDSQLDALRGLDMIDDALLEEIKAADSLNEVVAPV